MGAILVLNFSKSTPLLLIFKIMSINIAVGKHKIPESREDPKIINIT